MSEIQVLSRTQTISVSPQTQQINVDPQTNVPIVVGTPSSAISIINSGPIGPPGMAGDYDPTSLLVEVDTKIATHNQTTPIHGAATSGRDFAALFQNGLI